MQKFAIIDVVFAAIPLLFAALGARRGLWRALAGMLVMTLALAGAAWLTEVCAEGVEEVLRPTVTERVGEIVAKAMEEGAGTEIAQTESIETVERWLHRFGWTGNLSECIQESTKNVLEGVEKTLTEALVNAVLPSAVNTVLRAVFFTLLLVLLRLCERMLRPLMRRLPLLRQCDRALGAAAGGVQGMLILCAVLWVYSRMGAAEGTESFFLSLFIR